MKYLSVVLVLSVLLVNVCEPYSLEIGDQTNAQLAYVENVQLSAIPWEYVSKKVSYKDKNSIPAVIKAISVIDLDDGLGRVYITDGGIGYTTAKVKLASALGKGLNYQVKIFV